MTVRGSVLISLGYFAFAEQSDKCIAIDQSVKGCADCPAGPGDHVQGSQCARGGSNWYTCYKTIEDCCKDGQISWMPQNSQCVSNYTPSDASSTKAPKPAVTVCDKVVAKSAATTNSKCQEKCRTIQDGGSEDSDYTDNCMTEHYTWGNGRAQLSGKCFDSWVHGYIEPANLAGYRTIYNVMTPALCQKECQDDDDCVRFAWISPEGQSGSASTPYACMLKNRKQVEVPATIVYDDASTNPPEWDADYCNYGTKWQCFNGYRCAPCAGGKPSCIWGTDEHIMGWKFCPSSDVCEIPGDLSTTSKPSTNATTTEKTTTAPEPTIITTTTEETTTTTPKPTTETVTSTTALTTETTSSTEPASTSTGLSTDESSTSTGLSTDESSTTKMSTKTSTIISTYAPIIPLTFIPPKPSPKPTSTNPTTVTVTVTVPEITTATTETLTSLTTKSPSTTTFTTTTLPAQDNKTSVTTPTQVTTITTALPHTTTSASTPVTTTTKLTSAASRIATTTPEDESSDTVEIETTDAAKSETTECTECTTTDCTECSTACDCANDCSDCAACDESCGCSGCNHRHHHHHHHHACDGCNDCNSCGGCDNCHECDGCDADSTEAHGIDLRIHDKPKRIRIAVDN